MRKFSAIIVALLLALIGSLEFLEAR